MNAEVGPNRPFAWIAPRLVGLSGFVVSGLAPNAKCSRSRLWPLACLLPSLLIGRGATAQDCDISADDWSNIQLFRRCLEEGGVDQWNAPDGETVLHRASRWTDRPTIVLLLLDAGSDVRARTDVGDTPLHWGVRNGNPAVTSHLLAAGADPNARNDRGSTPLHVAVYNHNPVVTSHLLAAGADPNVAANGGYTPLHNATANENDRVAVLLLEAGGDPNALSNDGWTPFHSAVFQGGAISVFLEAGADVRLTNLHRAILFDDTLAAISALSGGADPATADNHGWSSLHFSVPMSQLGIVSRIVDAGVDPNVRTANGLTALHLAADPMIVDILVAAGADIGARNGLGRTPLHQAAAFRDPPVIEALLDAGADRTLRDTEGQRPIDLAEGNSRIEEDSPVLRRLRVPDGGQGIGLEDGADGDAVSASSLGENRGEGRLWWGAVGDCGCGGGRAAVPVGNACGDTDSPGLGGGTRWWTNAMGYSRSRHRSMRTNDGRTIL